MNIHYKPGGRAIKTCIAVGLCIIYGRVVGHSSVVAGIAAVVCLKPTGQESFKAMSMRLLSTLIGGILGLAVVYASIITPGYEQGWNILIVPAFILLCIYICNVIGAKDAVILACAIVLVVTAVFEEGLDRREALIYAIWRIIDTATGAVLATGINAVLWHTRGLAAKDVPDIERVSGDSTIPH
jgi:uncharacterized membrane protein YgaE (UPF0421/DUF939 family)